MLSRNAPKVIKDLYSVFEDALSAITVSIRDYQNPDAAPPSIFPYLAWGWGMDRFDPSLPEEDQRTVIKSWPERAKRRGTRWAVRDGLIPYGHRETIIEWFEESPPAERGTFCVEIEPTAPIPATASHGMRQSVLTNKRFDALLRCFRIKNPMNAPFYAGAAKRMAVVVTLPAVIEGGGP